MYSALAYYAVVTGLVILSLAGLVSLATGMGWLGLRRALRKGRACRECGLWATDMEVLIHECLDHKQE